MTAYQQCIYCVLQAISEDSLGVCFGGTDEGNEQHQIRLRKGWNAIKQLQRQRDEKRRKIDQQHQLDVLERMRGMVCEIDYTYHSAID